MCIDTLNERNGEDTIDVYSIDSLNERNGEDTVDVY